jgi:hypothetical protein
MKTPLNSFIAIDPGKRKYGWCLVLNGDIVDYGTEFVSGYSAGLKRVLSWGLPVVSEYPVIYESRLDAASNIADLQVWVNALRPVEKLRPSLWKGQTPKEIHRGRLARKLLSLGYLLADFPPEEEHDTWDAIGIALYYQLGFKL